jgi:DNA-binding transcriptional ArsR family regulator
MIDPAKEQWSQGEPYGKLLAFFKVLGNEDRLRIAGLLAGQEASIHDLAHLLEVRETDVVHHLDRLETLGLLRVRAEGDTPRYRFDGEALIRMNAEVFRAAGAVRPGDTGERGGDDAVLAAFVADGRLTQIPAQHKKRLVILDWLARKFEPGVRYPEREVNELIQRYHPDTASLRRYLVDHGFMQRDHGVYWRSPGTG